MVAGILGSECEWRCEDFPEDGKCFWEIWYWQKQLLLVAGTWNDEGIVSQYQDDIEKISETFLHAVLRASRKYDCGKLVVP